jgi:hypothetical protein
VREVLEREIGARLAPKTLVILKADSWQGSSWLLSLCIAFLCSYIYTWSCRALLLLLLHACCTFFGRLLCANTRRHTPRENSRLQAHRHTPQKQTTLPVCNCVVLGTVGSCKAFYWMRVSSCAAL